MNKRQSRVKGVDFSVNCNKQYAPHKYSEIHFDANLVEKSIEIIITFYTG